MEAKRKPNLSPCQVRPPLGQLDPHEELAFLCIAIVSLLAVGVGMSDHAKDMVHVIRADAAARAEFDTVLNSLVRPNRFGDEELSSQDAEDILAWIEHG